MKPKYWISSLCVLGALLGPRAFADEAYKNLKLLADTGETLEQGMKHFTKGLGVKCKNCHVKGAFESDKKATKEKSRAFFRRVLATADQTERDAALADLLRALGRKEAKRPERLWKGVGMLQLKRE